MITLDGLTKSYGSRLAVDGLTSQVREGHVTGFLGPNGAGKSTTMRMLLGLDRPTSGRALINGVAYRELRFPMQTIGAHLDGRALHPGRSARAHLLSLARYSGLSRRRVDEVVEMVGLESVARRRAGGFSLGMGQRLGIAAALLGDPQILVLDEPMNGLDADGVRWIRSLLKTFAAEGRTVLVSSHLMAEMHQTVDRVLVIARGRLVADCATEELLAGATSEVTLRLPDVDEQSRLIDRLHRDGMTVQVSAPGELSITGGSVERIGDLAFEAQVRLHTLEETPVTLEEGYLRLVKDEFEFTSPVTATVGAGR
jgi:ABC-2 type transport system ATP-binding protein